MVARKKYSYDKKLGERPIRFIEEYLVLPTGAKAGEKFKLEPYQKEIISQSNGWVHTKGRFLKHRSNYIEIPKGNGKTPLIAALAIYKACANSPQIKNGEIYVLAGDRDQAKILLKDCKDMIESSPKLVDKFDIQKDIIYHKKTRTFIKALSSESYSKHGPRPDVVIFDELHVQKNRDLYDTMVKAMFKKENSQVYMITTAGIVNTFGETIHDYAVKIRDGVLTNENWYVKIFAADIEDDPFDEKTWIKANPGYGTIINPFDFKAFVQTAKDMPSELNSFLRLHLNIWTGSEKAWIPINEWDACNLNPVSLDDLAGREVYGGIDLATVRDTCALVLISPRPDSEIVDIWAKFWIPKATALERDEKENINYSAWIKEGYVVATPGNAVDYDYIFKEVLQINEICNIICLAYDRKFAASLIIPLVDKGIECDPYGQGTVSMSFPAKHIEQLIINKKINHAGNPVLRWQVSNAFVVYDAHENISFHKGKSKDKIDGVVAMAMAAGQYLKSLNSDTIDEDYEFIVI